MAKIVIGGGPGAGTTTFIGAASEIPPLDSELVAGGAGVGVGVGVGREATTLGFDFGRLTLPPGLALSLFGLPSRRRGRLLGDVVAAGCCGFVVLVDERRPLSSRTAAEHARRLGVPHVVAINRTGGDDREWPAVAPAEVGRRLGTAPDVPVVSCDARSPESVRACLGVLAGSLRGRLEAVRQRDVGDDVGVEPPPTGTRRGWMDVGGPAAGLVAHGMRRAA